MRHITIHWKGQLARQRWTRGKRLRRHDEVFSREGLGRQAPHVGIVAVVGAEGPNKFTTGAPQVPNWIVIMQDFGVMSAKLLSGCWHRRKLHRCALCGASSKQSIQNSGPRSEVPLSGFIVVKSKQTKTNERGSQVHAELMKQQEDDEVKFSNVNCTAWTDVQGGEWCR